jgi:orotidine 5'-phosphate decarboxylase subfamily 2
MSSFVDKLHARVSAADSLLCVGLDPHEKELTAFLSDNHDDKCKAAYAFCERLVNATAPYAACYKPNAAFFEALGEGGLVMLRKVCTELIPNDVPVLLDVKRGDIGTTAAAYAQACYEYCGADAVTLSPLMGWDSIEPFVTGE